MTGEGALADLRCQTGLQRAAGMRIQRCGMHQLATGETDGGDIVRILL